MSNNKLLERFLRYVKIDTQSDPDSTTYPSTEGQWDLLRMLEAELKEILKSSDIKRTGFEGKNPKKEAKFAGLGKATDNPQG